LVNKADWIIYVLGPIGLSILSLFLLLNSPIEFQLVVVAKMVKSRKVEGHVFIQKSARRSFWILDCKDCKADSTVGDTYKPL
jgi:hypothetical protein